VSVKTRIDWAALLGEIAWLLGDPEPHLEGQRVPCSQERLATALGVPRGTLRGWMDGSEPKHTDGEKLLDRWCGLTGKARLFAPRERRSLTAYER
jgi:hypothetical protein